jgi:hypothetical protein
VLAPWCFGVTNRCTQRARSLLAAGERLQQGPRSD